jgi:hypothetical protein
MIVAFDAQGTTNATASAATSISFSNLTVGSGSNRALVVALSWQGTFSPSVGDAVTVTWDFGGTNQICTLINDAYGTNGSAVTAALYGLIAPTSGNKTLHVAWTGARDVCVDAASFTGVCQIGRFSSFAHGTLATGSTVQPQCTVTSATGNYCMGAICSVGSLSAGAATVVYFDTTPPNISGGSSRAPGAPSVVLDLSGSASTWVAVGVDIVAQPDTICAPCWWP